MMELTSKRRYKISEHGKEVAAGRERRREGQKVILFGTGEGMSERGREKHIEAEMFESIILTVNINSKWADVGPALGSWTVLKIEAFWGSRNQPNWLDAPRAKSPV